LVQQALREVVHLRFVWVAGLATLVMIVGVVVLREFNFGAEEGRFFRDYAEATLVLWGTVVAIMLNISMVQGGVERGSLVMTFMRGVRRHEWLLSRWLAVGVALAWLTLLGYVTLGILLARYGHDVPVHELTVAGGRMFLRLALVASFALTACAAARGLLLASGLALGLTLAAQLTSILGWVGRQSGTAVHWGWQMLDWLVPSFQMLEAGTSAWHALIYAAGYASLYALLACAIFSRREI
jgi:ABC-type transport system involved in multi-copper enzyme maturation permease subunit